ncbi:8998_t:CDS:2 [Diversispora eburnea]|uniref:8998_t:CDS:1 n=1 Tax=Diversispora eburnea TaxID=1213867 RepID=A0A9N8VNX9_9GLOM|nr:8998_t:CDS:2 [Diversispora eburnea]
MKTKKNGKITNNKNIKNTNDNINNDNNKKPSYTITDLLTKISSLIDTCDYELALKFANRALSMDENNVQVLEILGTIEIELGVFDEARENLSKAISINPNQGYSKYLYMGQLSSGLEAINYFQKLKCEEYLNQALEIDSNNSEVYQILASVRISQQRNDEAKSALLKSLDIWSHLEPALSVLEILQKENDQIVDLWYLYGWCYYCMSQAHLEDARDCLITCQKSFVLHDSCVINQKLRAGGVNIMEPYEAFDFSRINPATFHQSFINLPEIPVSPYYSPQNISNYSRDIVIIDDSDAEGDVTTYNNGNSLFPYNNSNLYTYNIQNRSPGGSIISISSGTQTSTDISPMRSNTSRFFSPNNREITSVTHQSRPSPSEEDQILICAECDEQLSEGLWALSCGHVICGSCAKKFKIKKRINCPSCKARTKPNNMIQLYV